MTDDSYNERVRDNDRAIDNLGQTLKDKHVFADETDARQSMDQELRPSRFRPVYRPLSDDEKALHDKIKATAVELETLVAGIPRKMEVYNMPSPERYRSLAMTALEEHVMWAIKFLTA